MKKLRSLPLVILAGVIALAWLTVGWWHASTDVAAAPAITVAALDTYMAGKASPLAGQGMTFIDQGRQHNVDPRLVVAIAGAESTFATNGDCATQRNNAWGWGGGWPDCWTFADWSEGIATVTDGLRRLYLDEGLTTIPAIGEKYCGSGCENWESNVTRFYRDELGGDMSDLTFTEGSTGLSFQWPVDPYTVEQRYACFNCIGNGKFHTGTDLTRDSQVRASADGIVVLMQPNDVGCAGPGTGDCDDHGLGNTVILRHELTYGRVLYTQYSHLASFASGLDTGECIAGGTHIAVMGGTGYGQDDYWSVHLHFEVKNQAVLGAPTAPNQHWGYTTPSHPDNFGYLNPQDLIGIAQVLGCERPLAGDWNGDGRDGVGLYESATAIFSFFDASGTAQERCDQQFGLLGDVAVVGDWNGDGFDTMGVYRPSEARFYLSNYATTCGPLGPADMQIQFGIADQDRTPVIGDWDGDGLDNVGLYRDSDPEAGGTARFHLGSDLNDDPTFALKVPFGVNGDFPIAGDWDADGKDDLGVFRPQDPNPDTNRFFLDMDREGGPHEIAVDLGDIGDIPVTGDWDGNGYESLGVFRPGTGQFFPRGDLPPLPTITISGGTCSDPEHCSGPLGTTFTVSGTGFTSGGTATQRIRLPEGSVIGETLAVAPSGISGIIGWDYTTACSDQLGEVQMWVMDDTTTLKSDKVYQMNTFSPDCEALSGPLVTNIMVSNGKTYLQDNLDVGKKLYIDRSHTFTSVPSGYIGQELIITANNDKTATNPDFLRFNLRNDAAVSVLFDNRVTALPAWLNGGTWTLAGDIIGTSDTPRRIYQKNFGAGPVELGGNAMAPMSGAGSNYNVVVTGSGGTSAPETTITGSPLSVTTNPDAIFSFTSSKESSTFECDLDGGGFGPCTSLESYYGLDEGSHTFQVRATDSFGVSDPTPATYAWIIYVSDHTGTTVAAGDYPVAVAVNPVTNQVYVANRGSISDMGNDSVTVIDGSDHSTTTVAVGNYPVALAVNPVTNKVYVANRDSDTVTVIDSSDNSTTTVAVGDSPVALAVNPVTNKAYVVNRDSDNVTVIDGSDNSTTTVAVGDSPTAVAVNPVTNKVYVAKRGSISDQAIDSVAVIDGSDHSTTTVAVASGSSAVVVNPVTNKIYVFDVNSDNETLTVIDGSDHSTTEVTVGNDPKVLAINSVTNKVYVANSGGGFGGDITVIDGSDNSTTTLDDGGYPVAVAVNPETNKIYVANQDSDNVMVIDGNDNSLTNVAAGDGPIAVAVNPVTNQVYVANSDSDNVTVINGSDNSSVADLSLSKTVNNSSPSEGDSVTYTLTVSNAGPEGATGVQVTDLLSPAVSLSSTVASQGDYNDGTGVWTVGALTSGASATLDLTVSVNIGSSGTITNSSEITASDQSDPDSIPDNNVPSEDDQDSVNIDVQGSGPLITDLVVSNGKTYLQDSLEVGKRPYSDRTYTFTSAPNEYIGHDLIVTANADKTATNPDFLRFNLTNNATVSVLFDNRVTTLPAWLNDGTWTLAGDIIGTSDTARRVYQKDFGTGPVQLGGNAMAPMSGAGSNYSVVVIAN